jgi:hypothetical protein
MGLERVTGGIKLLFSADTCSRFITTSFRFWQKKQVDNDLDEPFSQLPFYVVQVGDSKNFGSAFLLQISAEYLKSRGY